jgi:hypothetical protein
MRWESCLLFWLVSQGGHADAPPRLSGGSLAATLYCAFVANLFASCLPARFASYLLVAIASLDSDEMNRPDF